MVKPQIWLIGGTSDSAEIAIALSTHNLPYLVTVTTESARQLYPLTATVAVGKMTPERMAPFAQSHNIVGILDASHPFACEISRQAIAFATASGILYLRYERAGVALNTTTPSEALTDGIVTTVGSIDELLSRNLLQHQRVLLTLGCRDLYRFAALRQTAQLFARILPSVEAIAQAQAAGFASHEIVALRPPVFAPLEKALWQQWRITRVVAKASGQPSGEAVKRQVAAELGVGLILLQRPVVEYPQQTSDVLAAVEFCVPSDC